jgi:hypothetical protein
MAVHGGDEGPFTGAEDIRKIRPVSTGVEKILTPDRIQVKAGTK